MSTQSWTSWLLDSYASSVSHLPTEHDHDSQPSIDASSPASQPSSAVSMGSNSSQVSSYGPYVRTGRGGAGNFHWETKRDTNSSDVEAQQPLSLGERRKAAAKLERLQTTDAIEKRVSSAPYVHMGRGGAGNYTQSNEIQSAKSPRSASATYPSSASTPTYGRGGAGNLMAAADAKAKAQMDQDSREQQEAERRRVQIEQQVAGMLQPPPGVVIAMPSRRTSFVAGDV